MDSQTAAKGFDPGVFQILEERARLLARPIAEGDDGRTNLELVILRVGDERYGIPVERTGEVRPLSGLTKVPGLPAFWAGLVNLRGSLFPVLDLRAYLGLPGEGQSECYVAVVPGKSHSIAIMADEIRTSENVTRSDVGPPIEGVPSVISGVTADLIAVIDVDRLLSDPLLVIHEEAR